MDKQEFLIQPGESLTEAFSDQRIYWTVAGTIGGNVIERSVISSMRKTFGIAREIEGTVIFVDEELATSKVSVTANKPQYSTNRALLRLATIIASAAGMKAAANMKSGGLQYALFGVAVGNMGRLLQDFFPALSVPYKK